MKQQKKTPQKVSLSKKKGKEEKQKEDNTLDQEQLEQSVKKKSEKIKEEKKRNDKKKEDKKKDEIIKKSENQQQSTQKEIDESTIIDKPTIDERPMKQILQKTDSVQQSREEQDQSNQQIQESNSFQIDKNSDFINLKNKSNLFIKMVNKKFEKKLFDHTSSESDNENQVVKDKYRRNEFLSRDIQDWLAKTSNFIKKHKNLDYFSSELHKKDGKETKDKDLNKQEVQKYQIDDFQSLQVASIDDYLLENHFLRNDHQENLKNVKMKILERHAVLFGYFIHARETFSQEKHNYMTEQQDLFLKIKQFLNGKIQKVMKKLDNFNDSNMDKNSFVLSGTLGTVEEQAQNFKNHQLELKYQMSALQSQKQDFLQRYKTSDDINYVDIALHHQYIDIIFSEEYYKNEMDIAFFNQNIKNEIIQSKGEEFWENNKNQNLIKHQKKEELLSKREQNKMKELQLKKSENNKIIKNEIKIYTKWTLRTETPFFKFWNILLMLNGFYSTIAYLMYTVRVDYPNFQDYELWGLYACESIFFIDMILCFFKQKLEDDGQSRQDNLLTTAVNYLFSQQFAFDLIAIIPFGYIFSLRDFRLQFFWVLKLLRIRNLYYLFKTKNINPFIESFTLFQRRQILENQIEKYNNDQDKNFFKQKVQILSFYKMIRLFVWIVCIGFIAGQVFYIYSNDIYMYEQNIQKSDIYQIHKQNLNSKNQKDENNQLANENNNSTSLDNKDQIETDLQGNETNLTNETQSNIDTNLSNETSPVDNQVITNNQSQILDNSGSNFNTDGQKRNLKMLKFDQKIYKKKSFINNETPISLHQTDPITVQKIRKLYVKLIPDNLTQANQQNQSVQEQQSNQNTNDQQSNDSASIDNNTPNSNQIDDSQNNTNQTIVDQSTDETSNSTTDTSNNQTSDAPNSDNSTNSTDQASIDDQPSNSTDAQCTDSSKCSQVNLDNLPSQNIEYYASKFNIIDQDIGYQLLINTYFIFTSISIVGFGDYYPVSVHEKWAFIFCLLFFIFLFQYILMVIQKLIKRYQMFYYDFHDDIQLDRFFALILRFNMFKEMDHEQKTQIVETIKFQWENNKNNFILKHFDNKIFNNLPDSLMKKIYTDFVFKDFLKMFRRFLSFAKKNLDDQEKTKQNGLLSFSYQKTNSLVIQSKNICRLRKKVRSIMHVLRTFRNTQNDENKLLKQLSADQIQAQISRFRIQIDKMDQQKEKEKKMLRENFKKDFFGNQKVILFPYLTYQDDEYQNFVIQLLQSLEIRKYPKGYIIANELDECLEVLFVISGKYNVGYDINRKTIYRKQFGCQTIIGSFQMNFNRRFHFFYKVSKEMICYSVSRKNWKQLIKNFPSYFKLIKEKSLQMYNTHIYKPLMTFKNKDIRQYLNRKDYQQILAYKDQNFEFIRQCLNEMKKEQISELKKRKFQKIDQIKINWLMNTIQEKLQKYFQIAYQMTQRQEFMRTLLWEKVKLAISKDQIQNPQLFIEEFRHILVQGVTNKQFQDSNLTYEEQKLKNMQIQLMKQSIKMFAVNHYRRIISKLQKEQQIYQQSAENSLDYIQNAQISDNYDSSHNQYSYQFKQNKSRKMYMFKKFQENEEQFPKVDENTEENIVNDSESSEKKKLNRKAIMNDEEYSVDDSQEFFFPQSKKQQLRNQGRNIRMHYPNNKINHQNHFNYGNEIDRRPIIIQQDQLDYKQQDYERSQKYDQRRQNRTPNHLINNQILYQSKVKLIDYDADHEQNKKSFTLQKPTQQSQHVQNYNRQITTPPNRNQNSRQNNFQKNESYQNDNQMFIRSNNMKQIMSQKQMQSNFSVDDY